MEEHERERRIRSEEEGDIKLTPVTVFILQYFLHDGNSLLK